VVAYLFWSADVSATIGRDDVANRVSGNRHPLAVHFDLIMVANHATLGRAAIRQAAARTLAVISLELRVEILMPFIVADPVMPFLRACACTKESGERIKKRAGMNPRLHISVPPARMEARAFSLANV
jgi:hypothetical protein